MKKDSMNQFPGSERVDSQKIIESKRITVYMKQRDWKLLSSLERWGVLGIGQLHGVALRDSLGSEDLARLFFNETRRREYSTRVSKRLRQLCRSGLMQAHSYDSYPQLFTLAKRGHHSLRQRGLARFLGYRKSISLPQAEHEITVNGVGLLLSESLGFDVRTERERYAWSGRGGWSPAADRMPIADLWIVDPLQPKAVEVELNQKSELRYKEIWRAYRSRLRSKAAVLYLTGWPGGIRCLLTHAARFEADFIYVCGLQEFRKSHGRHPFLGYRQSQQLVLNSRPVPATDAFPLTSPVTFAGLATRGTR